MEKESCIPTTHAVRGHFIPLQGTLMSHLRKLPTLAAKLQRENQVLFCLIPPHSGEKREGERGLGRVPGSLMSLSQGALFKCMMGMKGCY